MKRTILAIVGALALVATIVVSKGDGPSPGQAQQAGFSVCPPAGGWAMAVWTGANNTPTAQAIVTCVGVSVDAVFWFNTQEQTWRFFFIGAPPEVNTLSALNNGQVVFLHGGQAAAPTPTPTPTPRPSLLSGRYLLAFHACNTATTNCNDPRNHLTYIGQSDDGAAWSPVPGYVPRPGSVPDLIRRGNTLYVFNPGQVWRYRIDADVWETPLFVSVTRADGAQELFVDPSPFLDEEGRIVLFYLVGQLGSDPARCPPGQTTCVKTFRSATEVAGSDGTAFAVDSGNRLEVAISGSDTASDPDIFTAPSGFVLYISRGASVRATSSTDLRGSYTDIPGLPGGMLVSGAGGVPSGHYDPVTGQFWTYVHQRQGNVSVILRAVHSRLDTPLSASDFNTSVAGSSFPGLGSSYTIESPGFTLNQP